MKEANIQKLLLIVLEHPVALCIPILGFSLHLYATPPTDLIQYMDGVAQRQ
jgi:hypothetical protein